MRGSSAVYMIVALFGLLTASPAHSKASWSYEPRPRDGLHKLFYVHDGEMHGELYFRCEPEAGWIFLIPSLSEPRDYLLMQSGTARVSAPARVTSSVLDEGFDLDVAIPAQHGIFREMADGQALIIEKSSYPVATLDDKRNIAFFIQACDGEGE